MKLRIPTHSPIYVADMLTQRLGGKWMCEIGINRRIIHGEEFPLITFVNVGFGKKSFNLFEAILALSVVEVPFNFVDVVFSRTNPKRLIEPNEVYHLIAHFDDNKQSVTNQ